MFQAVFAGVGSDDETKVIKRFLEVAELLPAGRSLPQLVDMAGGATFLCVLIDVPIGEIGEDATTRGR